MLSRIGVAIATLLAIAIRRPLLFRPMRTDEAATVLYYAARPLSIGLSIYGSPNNHILHTALVHITWSLFGPAEWALRLPAFLAGVALVPLAYVTARALGAGSGVLPAAIVATLPILVDYSTDARGYTIVCAFTLLATLAAARMRERGDRASAITFAVMIALGLWTIPIMVYPFVMLATWALLSTHWRVALAASAGAALLALALYAPVLTVSGVDALISNPWVRPVPWPRFFAAFPRLLADVWRSWMTAVPLPLAVAFGIAFIAGAVRARMTLWIGLLPVLLLVVAQHSIPFPRTWLPLLVLATIAMGASIPANAKPIVELTVVLTVAVLLAYCALRIPRRPETGELPHVREIARFLAENARPNDAVGTLSPSDVPLAFYLDGRVLRPDVHASRIFVVTNEEYGQFLAKTLVELTLDPRRFNIARRADFGNAAVYQLDRR